MGDRSISQTGIDRKRDVLAPETGISGEQGGCWLQVCLDQGFLDLCGQHSGTG